MHRDGDRARPSSLRRARRTSAAFAFGALALGALSSVAPERVQAQELEPGAYWPFPAGLNILTVANSFSWGDVAFDPAAPIERATARINTTALSFTRGFGLAGRSANMGVVWPVIVGHVEGLYLDQPAEADRLGFGDPRLRLSLNLHGAPAMTPQSFAAYRPRTLVGISATIVPPLGEYDPSKLINLGTNRWSFKSELGLSVPVGDWAVEAMTGAWFFTENPDFYGGRTRTQEPIVAAQLHLTYKFTRTTWLAANANYFTGGRTTVGGNRNVDLQRNSRVGMTFSSALDRHQAIRAFVSRGARTTIGADFTSVGVGYNYFWAR